MRHKFFLFASLLLLLSGCQKENMSEGSIMLTTEGFTSNTKTSVSDLSVQWVNGDRVCLNWDVLPVTVSNEQAYVESSLSGEVWGFSPASLNDAFVSWDNETKQLSFDFPSSYTCSYVDGRQKIDLPMAAYASSVGSTIQFKHLSAAVKVLVRNDIAGTTLTLDSVVVSSEAYKLSGSTTATLSNDADPVIAPEGGNGRVTVLFSDHPTIAENCTTEVQVPILPIGTSNLTIEVFAHHQGDSIEITDVPTVYKSVDYHFHGTNSSATLGRNVMLTARISIKNTTPSTEVDHSLFSVGSGKQVRFSKGNLRATYSGSSWTWGFASNQYDLIGNAVGNTAITTASGTPASLSTAGTVDLFGWSTSTTYYGVANSNAASTYSGDFVDWGGVVNGSWGTPTSAEWNYLINGRSARTSNLPGDNSTTVRYTKAAIQIDGFTTVNGIILFPDNYRHPLTGVTFTGTPQYNTSNAEFSSFTVTTAGWNLMEAAGAIFLPAAGYRSGTSVYNVQSYGNYWSASNSSSDNAYRFFFSNNEAVAQNSHGR